MILLQYLFRTSLHEILNFKSSLDALHLMRCEIYVKFLLIGKPAHLTLTGEAKVLLSLWPFTVDLVKQKDYILPCELV